MDAKAALTGPARETLDRALSLSENERALIAEVLFDSLDDPNPEEVERAWIEVARRRAAEIDSGSVVCRPFEDVMAELRARYS